MISYDLLKAVENGNRIILENDTELHEIKEECYSLAQEAGIYIEIEEDVVSSGGLIRKKTYPCLVIRHPEHRKDYYSFCIMITSDSTRKFADIYKMGFSKLEDKIRFAGKISHLLHGNQYEIEYQAEASFYKAVQKIWDGMHE